MIWIFTAYEPSGYWPFWQVLLCIGILYSLFVDQKKTHQALASFWLSDTGEMQFHMQEDMYQVVRVKWVSPYFCSLMIRKKESKKVRNILIWHDTLTLYAYKSLCRSLLHIRHRLH